MPVLMKDVAEKVGVSLSTVSQVLSGNRRLAISKETRQRVLEAARELDYRPNVNAQRLAKRKGNAFGLIVSEIANPFFPDIINSFEAAAVDRGFEIMLCNTEYDTDRSRSATQKLLDNKVRGVAIVTSKFDPDLIQQFTEHRVPVLLFNNERKDLAPGNIEIDLTTGLREAVEHLASLGHKNFAAITGPSSVPSARAFTGVLERLGAKMGIHFQRVLECNYRHDGGMAAIRKLMGEPHLPTAIFCANDVMAIGAISVLEQEGISVPEQISIVGLDDIIYARLARPPLTTIAVPRTEIGGVAFDMLFRMQKTKRPQREMHTVSTHLVIRQSTAKARRSAISPRTNP
jgi:DNA-binding LacI/PurR family transcriptional regulator